MPNSNQPHIHEFKRGERLSASHLNEITSAVSRLISGKQPVKGHAYAIEQPLEIVVILDADLNAATHSLTGATSALATVCRWSSADGEYTETTHQETVWNHSENTNHVADTFGVARWIDGHWHFFGDCHAMAAR